MAHHSTKKAVKWLLPCLFIFLVAPFTPALDLFFARTAFTIDKGFLFNPFFFKLLFIYGEIIGFAAAIGALVLLVCSFKWRSLQKYRGCLLAFLCTMVIGAGLFTNVLLKGYWGRPRPKQLIEFGGNFAYRPYYKPYFSPPEPIKSFPSGHVAMGFSFISFALSFKRMRREKLYYLALAMTLLLGGGLTIARITQGGHFFSDVTFSLALIWYVALLSDYLLFTSAKWSHWLALPNGHAPNS